MEETIARVKINKANVDRSLLDLGVPKWKEMLWLMINAVFFQNYLNPFSSLRIFWLRQFGAQIGHHCQVRARAFIRSPWLLKMGNYSSIGEEVWIENRGMVEIGDQCTISQRAMIMTGGHNYKSPSFSIIVMPLTKLEDGVWICSNAMVNGGITCKSHSILGIGAVAIKDLEAYTIYSGNPAVAVKERVIDASIK